MVTRGLLLLATVLLLPGRGLGSGECVPGEEHRLTQPMKLEMLRLHNLYRLQAPGVPDHAKPCNMKAMVWDSALEKIAQDWADKCTYKHGVPHTALVDGLVFYKYPKHMGQNLWVSSRKPDCDSDQTPAWAVKHWYENELQFMNFSQGSLFKSRGWEEGGACSGYECWHLTQIMWSNSCRVGCARGNCPWTYIVCQYYQSGNYENQLMYQTECDSECAEKDDEGGCACDVEMSDVCEDLESQAVCQMLALAPNYACLHSPDNLVQYHHMVANCRKTCGFCVSEEGTEEGQARATECENQLPFKRCRRFFRFNPTFCHNDRDLNPYVQFARDSCAHFCQWKSPEWCAAQEEGVVSCVDRTAQCVNLAGAGLCDDPDYTDLSDHHPMFGTDAYTARFHYFLYMSQHCPNTCGYCHNLREEFV